MTFVSPSTPKRDVTAATLCQDEETLLSILRQHVSPECLDSPAFWKDGSGLMPFCESICSMNIEAFPNQQGAAGSQPGAGRRMRGAVGGVFSSIGALVTHRKGDATTRGSTPTRITSSVPKRTRSPSKSPSKSPSARPTPAKAAVRGGGFANTDKRSSLRRFGGNWITGQQTGRSLSLHSKPSTCLKENPVEGGDFLDRLSSTVGRKLSPVNCRQ